MGKHLTELSAMHPQPLLCRYLILDEELYFLNNTKGEKSRTSVTVLEDVKRALQESGFDDAVFKARGGEWCSDDKKLKW